MNTLAADDKYSRRNVQNFQQQVPTALSQTQKIFPAILTSFHKSTSNLERFFKKKMSVLGYVFPKLWTPKEVVTLKSKTPSCRTSSGNQRGHGLQTLLKSTRHH